MGDNQDTWSGGQTWVFQGTVAEDATAGTHVCTLTVTPGAGNEFQVNAGMIIVGNTATSQQANVTVTDGTNSLLLFDFSAGTTANLRKTFPTPVAVSASSNNYDFALPPPSVMPISGAMQLILKVTTAAVSVTQTFSVVCRLKTGQIPTAVLADSVGTPTLTINTNKVF